jgi:hypothetical protein
MIRSQKPVIIYTGICTGTYYTQKKSFVKGVFEKNVKKCKKIAHFFPQSGPESFFLKKTSGKIDK